MDAAALKFVVDNAETKELQIKGASYVTKPVFDPRLREPEQSPLEVAGLEGLVEYLAAHPASKETGFSADQVVCHISSPVRVTLLSRPFGDFSQRNGFARASADLPNLYLGDWTDPETFIIRLQTLFVNEHDRAAVLSIVGNLRDEQVQTVADDGITQGVTVKKGITLNASALVPNPVTLAPYRTFHEVEQPPSPFVLRLRGGKEGVLPSCALFEADGGLWRKDALAEIKAWLVTNLPKTVPIIG